jgi:phosphoserine phosphatase RsbX
MDEALTSDLADWAVASRALPGESENGDAHVVAPFFGGLLVAAIDGLGHGTHAAHAARLAAETLRAHPMDAPENLVARCQEDLRGTRGVVLSIASLSATGTLTWLGVGNVEGILLRASSTRAREAILLRGGVVGYEIPSLRPVCLDIEPGDTLIFVTDGIVSAFTEKLDATQPPQSIADEILAQYARPTDDALVLVVRYRGLHS